MTREEAIKTLKENYCAMCAYGSQDMDSCDIRSCDSKDAIKALEQEPRWIPVTERLPDKDGLYLVSVKNDHERRYSKTCWYSNKNWFARQDVVAWMPLPQPYKAESEDK